MVTWWSISTLGNNMKTVVQFLTSLSEKTRIFNLVVDVDHILPFGLIKSHGWSSLCHSQAATPTVIADGCEGVLPT